MTLDDLRRALRPLSVKVSNLIGRGTIKQVDDSKALQEVQVELLEDETREEIERFQQYGFTSVPKGDSDCVVIFPGGRRDQGFCLGVEDQRSRPTGLAEGEVSLYAMHGQRIVLKANGDVEITPKAGQVIALAGATNPVAKGDSLNSAIATLATAIASAVSGIPTGGTAAGAAITTAIGTFSASAAAALSTKVKLS